MEWEAIVQEDDLQVLRRFHTDSGLYEYRCSGSYSDVCARDFIDAQMDIEYRKRWDPNVLKLELLDKYEDGGSEIVRWVVKFPFFMYPREYIYVRRRYVDMERNCVIIANTALNSDRFPPVNEYVRVSTYKSTTIIRAHNSLDEKGFDYVVTYYENPECNFPTYAYNWVVNNAGPYFLQRAHNAAKELETRRIKNETFDILISEPENQESNAASVMDKSTSRDEKVEAIDEIPDENFDSNVDALSGEDMSSLEEASSNDAVQVDSANAVAAVRYANESRETAVGGSCKKYDLQNKLDAGDRK